MTDGSEITPKLLWSVYFQGSGQGVYRMEVLDQAGKLNMAVRHVYSLDRPWMLPMRNASSYDIDLAQENFKTLMWRAGIWYVQALMSHLNVRISDHPLSEGCPPKHLYYSVYPIKDNPFIDPERHSPICVIDRHTAKYKNRAGSKVLTWYQEPWAAVFMHDGSLLSCLPENDELYFPLPDFMDLVIPMLQHLPVDQADFLGRAHAVFKPTPAQLELSFLDAWMQ